MKVQRSMLIEQFRNEIHEDDITKKLVRFRKHFLPKQAETGLVKFSDWTSLNGKGGGGAVAEWYKVLHLSKKLKDPMFAPSPGKL